MADKSSKEFQSFLDNNQYTSSGILRYERVFGRGFVSTGGLETTKEFVEMLNLAPGQKVLDVGCGIGGSAFYMIKNFHVEVRAVDLSTNMIEIGKQRAAEFEIDKVDFEVEDITSAKYEPGTFDVIYSRDTILHIEDKESLFTNFLTWLKPGGQLLISDYSCGTGEWSKRFKAYVTQRHYHLLDPESYGKLVEKVGFSNVRAVDRTLQFMDVLQKEREKTEKQKDEMLKSFSLEEYNILVEGWSAKLERCRDGDQRWVLVHAFKPQ
ncbi:predicted protein [Nematostella vectensis]|uniref:phosphoethanolamine N-methyltransferase n=1 Tax=Nematostella vectensis TaxID=45351 RepID=A7S0M9_NEMVE|nr:predicted protein [Nematostella vectensis]|eukprot:XP_001634828.1 predicted protein [Nematostella vectensis]